MYYEVFLDVLFLVNLWMDFFLLRLVSRLLHVHAAIGRSLWGACIGSAGVCMLLVCPVTRYLNILLVHVVINTLMIRFGCGVKKIQELILGVVLLYVCTFFMGGFLQFFKQEMGTHNVYFWMLLAAVAYGVMALLLMVQAKMSAKKEHTYTACIYANGKCKKVQAFMDTGNQLFDPVSKKPVSIISVFAMEELLSAEQVKQLKNFHEGIVDVEALGRLRPHFLQFECLGCTKGMAVAVSLDYLCLENYKTQKIITNPIVALYEESEGFLREYEMILHPNLIDS